MKKYLTPAIVAAALFGADAASAAPILNLNDFAIPIDSDEPFIEPSSYPINENPFFAFDGDITTKYLNFGELGSGVILTPAAGSTTLQSMILTTANDAVERDPTSWKIWGTNDAITTPDNTTGGPFAENWSLIAQGTVDLPMTRQTAGPVLSFANATPYTSYRITFPTVRDTGTANSMQVSEIGLYQSNNGTGDNVGLNPIDARAVVVDPVSVPDSASPAAEGVVNVLDSNGPRFDLGAQSNYPAAEGPANTIDGTLAKYLNGGGANSGFIVTPAAGSSTVRSFQITTANDAPERDPTSYELYGTNAAIVSADNSLGTAENWTLISAGSLALPPDRDTLGPIVPVTNNASYTSYKMLFPSIVAGGAFQIAEASFFPDTAGTGTDILNAGDPIIAIGFRSGLETKYLNFGEENSGLIVTPSAGPKVVTSMQITTANDAVARDPASYEIYGTNAPITSDPHSQGTEETWTLISSGALTLPDARFTDGEVVTFANTTAYSSYKIVFPTVKDAEAANSMQIAKLQLFDNLAPADADFDNDGDVDGADFLTWQRNVGSAGGNNVGDADGNGQINGLDLAAWRAEFGPNAVAAVGAVPEPGTLLLGGLAAGLAAAVCRRTGKRE